MTAVREQDWGQPTPQPMGASKRQAIGASTRPCKRCRQTVFWARSPRGKSLPFDMDKAGDVAVDQHGALHFVLSRKPHECQIAQEPVDLFATETIHGIEIAKHEADTIRACNADPEMALIKAAHSEAMRECFNNRSVPEAQKLWDSDAYFEIRDAYFTAIDLRKPRRSVRGVGFQGEERKR